MDIIAIDIYRGLGQSVREIEREIKRDKEKRKR